MVGGAGCIEGMRRVCGLDVHLAGITGKYLGLGPPSFHPPPFPLGPPYPTR